jgi:hypothetical protein
MFFLWIEVCRVKGGFFLNESSQVSLFYVLDDFVEIDKRIKETKHRTQKKPVQVF